MDPSNSEYRMYAGMAAYWEKDMEKAVSLLDGVTARYPEQDLFRLTVLEKASMGIDPQKSARYSVQKQAVIDKNEAQGYNDMKIIPLINALGQAR